jgi:hypothetical protein
VSLYIDGCSILNKKVNRVMYGKREGKTLGHISCCCFYDLCTSNKMFFEDGCLLRCSAVWTGMSLPTFQRSVLPPSSGR